jgi:hypothetical protein
MHVCMCACMHAKSLVCVRSAQSSEARNLNAHAKNSRENSTHYYLQNFAQCILEGNTKNYNGATVVPVEINTLRHLNVYKYTYMQVCMNVDIGLLTMLYVCKFSFTNEKGTASHV